MTGFSGIILFIVSFYATINFYRMFSESRRIFHFCLGTSAVFVAIVAVSGFLAHFFPVLDPYFINDWSSIFAVSFLLSAAAALIRDSKPVFARFPRIFSFTPLLLIFFYPLVMETVVLKQWFHILYQGSAITIGILIYSYKTWENSRFGYMLAGVGFFLVTFILYWIPSTLFTLPEYGWVLLVACGILMITVGYNQIYGHGIDEQPGKVSPDQWFI